MKRDVYYIVYNPDSLKIADTFRWMGKDVLKLLNSDKALKCLNVTHPKTKSLLADINKVNNTNYA